MSIPGSSATNRGPANKLGTRRGPPKQTDRLAGMIVSQAEKKQTGNRSRKVQHRGSSHGQGQVVANALTDGASQLRGKRRRRLRTALTHLG